jgi:hypothetical protein
MQIYKSYINQMMSITGDVNLVDKYFKLDYTKRSGYEDFCLQFALSLMNFFKNNWYC